MQLIFVLMVGSLFLNYFSPYGITFVVTPSIKQGLYFKTPKSNLKLNEFACFVYEAPDWAKDRHYLTEGQAICKQVLGMQGDKVVFEADSVFIEHKNGSKIFVGNFLQKDSAGRTVPAELKSNYYIEADYFYMGSTLRKNSYDSRYLRSIHMNLITNKIIPFLVW